MAHESQQSKPRGGTLISNHGFCYPDLNPMNSFDANPELFTLQTGMEMLGLPPSKPRGPELHQQRNQFTWKGFTTTTTKQETSRGTTTMDPTNHYYFSEPTSNENLMVSPETGWSDPTSLQCVFNNRPSQGLSLRPPDVGFYASSSSSSMLGFSEAVAVAPPLPPSPHVQMRNSKYLVPAQELLNEFCSLGNSGDGGATKNKSRKTHQSDDGDSSRNQSLYSMDLLELQKRKTRLLTMLEEVDGRYRHYCEQMKAVVSTFEAVAGEGTARVYSSLASKAMSRHFRCLRDGIVGQIKATNKAMKEKDVVVPGASKGETPRLRVLDQTIRQQKAFQQMGLMESHPWRPQRGLPERSVSVLRAWLFEHFLHPYPSDVDKHILARQTGLSRSQVSNWFINARVRLWKPMVEEMYMEETKEQDILLGRLENNENNNNNNNDSRPNHHHLLHHNQNPSSPTRNSEHKPLTNHGLLLHDPDSLSSIITSTHNNNNDSHNQFMRGAPEAFGVADVDFSSYNNNSNKNNSDNNLHHHHNFGGGVSLTLGLQQHGSGGMSLSFSPTTQQSLFFSRESVDVDDCQPVQFSILDGEGSNLPYRNLMGTQLLHDMAG